MNQLELLAIDVLASLNNKCDIKPLIKRPIIYSRILQLAEENMSVDQREFYRQIGDRLRGDDKQSFDFRDNIYMISGLPGTGKSFLQSVIHLFCLTLTSKRILCLAPTNLIAYQQKGKTIHSQIKDILSLFSISSGRDIELKLAKSLVQEFHIVESFGELRKMSLSQLTEAISQLARIRGSYTKLNVMAEESSKMIILIDEGTMVSSLLFAVVFLRFPRAVFIIMYGPNQLPPISGVLKLPDCEYSILNDNCDHIYTLDTQIRFDSGDNNNIFIEFVKYFSNALSGQLCNSSNETKLNKVKYFLKNLKIGGNLADYRKLYHGDRILIVNTNKQRSFENNQRLMAEGEGPIYNIDAIIPEELPSNYNLESQMGIDKVLRIRKGVMCMLKANALHMGLVKGMIVKVEDILLDDDEDMTVSEIVITVIETKKKISLSRFDLETNYLKDPKAETGFVYIRQFPITLAYSLTAYSSQGKTLDCDIGIDLRTSSSSDHLINAFFVALTRVRNPAQLFMNEHPVYWLEPSLNICNLDDFERIKRRILLSFPTPTPKSRLKSDINNIYSLNEIIEFVQK